MGLVDQLLAFLLGTGHVLEELGHFLRRIDIEQLHGGDLDAALIFIDDALQELLRGLLDRGFAHG